MKAQQANTQKKVGALVNLGLRHAQRVWKTYLEGGIEAFTKPKQPTYLGKLDTTQITRFRAYLQDDQAQTARQTGKPIWRAVWA
ncbi:hypothetical protein GCM10027578_27160 [Spirosoma luteolum]